MIAVVTSRVTLVSLEVVPNLGNRGFGFQLHVIIQRRVQGRVAHEFLQ